MEITATTDVLDTNNTNSSLGNVTAGGEKESSLNTTEQILVPLAAFSIIGYVLILLLLPLYLDKDAYVYAYIKKLFKPFTAPGSWRHNCGENCLKVFILIFCVIIPTGGYLTICLAIAGLFAWPCVKCLKLIYRFCVKPVYRLCVDYPRKARDLFLFTLFNIMLNGSDVVLDILTAEDLGNPTPVSYQRLTIFVYQASLGSRCGRVSPSVGSSLPSSTASPPSS